VWLNVSLAQTPSKRLAPSHPHEMVHARSIVASRNGAAGYKVMRSPRTRHGHHRWTRSTHTSCGKGRNHHATVKKTALTSIGSYKETFERLIYIINSRL
jgi:hypothetical protein